MDNDFGYFLITIGIMWIIITAPFDVSFMNNELTLPIGLIIIGSLSVILGLVHVKHISGVTFAIFIALMIKSWTFPFMGMPFNMMHDALSETSVQSFNSNPSKIITYDCPVCSDVINSSGTNELIINSRHSRNVSIEGLETNNTIDLRIKFNKTLNVAGAESTISLPIIFKGINYDLGVGSLKLNPESLITIESMNLSTGTGSLEIELGNVNASIINLDTGVGSIDVNIPRINCLTVINAHSGVGSIDLTIGNGIEYKLELNTGLGSVNNNQASQSTGYDTAVNKLLIKASTGIGSINVK